MKKLFFALPIIFFIDIFAFDVYADLNGYLSELNASAKADMNGYAVQLSAHFNAPLPEVRVMLKNVAFPADAFMCLQLSLMTNIRLESVIEVYHSHKHKGWGAIAKELGIKPGSADFHYLKRGDFAFYADRKRDTNMKHGVGTVTDKGHKNRKR